jgi:hypothetical protein
MARLFLSLVAGAAATDAFVPGVEAPAEAIQIIYGITEGMLSDQPHLSTCIADALASVDDGKKALVDLKKAVVDKDVLELADALDAMADTLRMIPATMAPCDATEDDVASVVAALKEIEGFRDLLKKMNKHFIFNHKAIIGDIVAARASRKDGDYEGFGKHLGMALHRLALGKFNDDVFTDSDEEIKPVLEFIYGVSVGMLSDQRHLATCITNGLATGDDAKAALVDVKRAVVDKNMLEFADALDAMADTLRMIPATLSPCGATEDDAKDILAALKEIDGFKDFLKKAEKHLILNEKSIVADAVACKEAFMTEDCGEHVGDALHKIAFGRFHDGIIV